MIGPDDPDFPHRTTTGYRKHGCRCPECTDAQRLAMEDYRRTKGVQPSKARAVAEHGTRTMYRRCTAGPNGKKCEECKDANRRYQRSYMAVRRSGLDWTSDIDKILGL